LSKEDVSALIKSEIASRLEQYEQQLAAAKAESKRQKAELKVKEAEINSLRKEIAALQDQAKSPAHSTAASSPPDLPGRFFFQWVKSVEEGAGGGGSACVTGWPDQRPAYSSSIRPNIVLWRMKGGACWTVPLCSA
jgi:predicted phage gp36 major capsid-like protein